MATDSPRSGPALGRGRSNARPDPGPAAQAPLLWGLRSSAAAGKLVGIKYRRQEDVPLLI